MRIAVLGNAGSWYLAELQRAASERGDECFLVDYRLLVSVVGGDTETLRVGDARLEQCDTIVVRSMPPGSLEQVVYRMDALARLEARGVAVVNSPRSLECAIDKYLCTARLAAAGIPVPRTIVCEGREQGLEAFEAFGRDVVIKPLFGSEGRGIVRVSDPDLAWRTLTALERIDAVLYLQEFVPHAGFDLRVLVLDGEILGAVRRSHPTDFRTNAARQAKLSVHQPTDSEIDLSLRAVQTVGARFAGVDLLYSGPEMCYVVEVNGVPGWRGFQRATGIDVASRFLASLQQTSL